MIIVSIILSFHPTQNCPTGDGDGDDELVVICHVSASGQQQTLALSPNAANMHLEQHDGLQGMDLTFQVNVLVRISQRLPG